MEQVLQEFQTREDRMIEKVMLINSNLEESAKNWAETEQKMEELRSAEQKINNHRKRLTIVQETLQQLERLESRVLKLSQRRGMETHSQRMASRPVEMAGVVASNAADDEGSSGNERQAIVNELHTIARKTGNDVVANRMLTCARRRGWILDGEKKPGGLMEKQNKE